jgi:hypothetical protein
MEYGGIDPWPSGRVVYSDLFFIGRHSRSVRFSANFGLFSTICFWKKPLLWLIKLFFKLIIRTTIHHT